MPPLDAISFENGYTTIEELVCSAVSKERACNSHAKCTSHTITDGTTEPTIHLQLVQEIRAQRARILAITNAPFLLKFLVPAVNGQSAWWLHVYLCEKCSCAGVTDSFFANCRTHQLLCCGVAIFKTNGI
jgi:hypothetical protein